jgi:PAS domain S-box-containing protein
MELDQFEKNFLQLANNIDAVFWLKDSTNTELHYVSPKYEEVWRRTCDELYANPLSFFNSIHPDDLDFVKTHFENEQLQKMKFDAEYRIIKPNEEIRWIRDRGFPVTNDQGQIYRCAGMAWDITEQKNMEETLKDHQKSLEELVSKRTQELENSNKLLEEFVGVSSHDLQEPLRKIIIFGDRLKTKISPTDHDAFDYLDRMQKSALRMRNLVENLLQYTRVDHSKSDYKTLDINIVIQAVLEDLETRISETQGAVYTVDFPVIEGDPTQSHQLFLNIIGNGLKFYRKGIPPIVKMKSIKKENAFWEITVEDIGIDEEHIDKIFNPFERLHGRCDYEGTGIGLTICNKIVSRHGGEISVKPNSTHGVTFHITLPEKQNNG